MNKNSALTSLRKGEHLIKIGEFERGKKFIEKAKRLDPDLTLVCDRILEKGSTQKKEEKKGKENFQSKNEEKGEMPKTTENDPIKTEKKETVDKEIEMEIIRIMKEKDYYKILSVDRKCTEIQIRKAYKRKAFKFHPDRCKHSKSTDCFKKISQAFVCLSDAEKRKFYDENGMEADDVSRTRNHTYEFRGRGGRNFHFNGNADDFFFHMFSQMFEEDFRGVRRRNVNQDPFNIFFDNRYRTTRRRNNEVNMKSGLLNLIILGCVILFTFFFLGGFFNMGKEKKSFSFERNRNFPVKMKNDILPEIFYFVPRSFNMFFKPYIDNQVINEYKFNLKNNCTTENKNFQEAVKKIKKNIKGKKKEEKIEELRKKKKYCKQYKRMFG